MGTYIVILRRVARKAKDNLRAITVSILWGENSNHYLRLLQANGGRIRPPSLAVAMLIGQDRKPPRDYARDRGVGLVNRSQGFFSDVTSITGGIVLKGPGQIPTFA